MLLFRVTPPDLSPERTGERKPLTALDLFARSRGADRDRWLGFQAEFFTLIGREDQSVAGATCPYAIKN